MNRAEKNEVIDGLKQTFEESGGVILLGFKGIDVPNITELRQQIRESDGGYRVVKNTLAIRAAEGTPVKGLEEFFTGPTAIAYTRENPVGLAKVLKAFVKTNEGMTFKAGVLEGRVISVDQVADLANMPSREELLSKLAYLLNAPLTRFATALMSPLRNLAVGLKQIGEKK